MSKFHPLAILLKFEGYPPAVFLSVILHALLIYFILGRSVTPSDYITIEDPMIVTATAVDVNPQRLRRLERLEKEQAADDRRRQQEQAQARRAQEERARQERLAQEQREARVRTEAERRRQEELERQRIANAEAERQRLAEESRRREAEQARQREQQRLAEQAAREAQASQVASENLEVAEYAAIIRRIISQNWQIPPSARNGMSATVSLRLVPTGEVVASSILQSSGDAVFDRSVLQAVERADRFPELQDLDNSVFERNFRNFTLVFRPEDLLR